MIFLGNSIGDCTVDSFTISSPGNVASPVICGFNTKQHSNSFKILYSLFTNNIFCSHLITSLNKKETFLKTYFEINISPVYVDATSQCSKAAFNFGTGTYNRQVDIKVHLKKHEYVNRNVMSLISV